MNLQVFVPERIVIFAPGVRTITARSVNGSFGILEHHIDFVTLLVTGILAYVADGREGYIAVDEGTLVKTGPLVAVSVHHAVAGSELGKLRGTIERRFGERDESETRARSSLARLEARFTRNLIRLHHA